MNFLDDKRRSYFYRELMENLLGRKLKKEEVVHHIDNNPLNNTPTNLMVFPSSKEHTQYHYHKLREQQIISGEYKYPNQKALEYYVNNKEKVLRRELLKRMKEDKGDLICEECDRKFKNNSAMANHLRWHKGHWRAMKGGVEN